jgi:hypothetical protein
MKWRHSKARNCLVDDVPDVCCTGRSGDKQSKPTNPEYRMNSDEGIHVVSDDDEYGIIGTHTRLTEPRCCRGYGTVQIAIREAGGSRDDRPMFGLVLGRLSNQIEPRQPPHSG